MSRRINNKYEEYLDILDVTTDFIVLCSASDPDERTLTCERWNMESKKYE